MAASRNIYTKHRKRKRTQSCPFSNFIKTIRLKQCLKRTRSPMTISTCCYTDYWECLLCDVRSVFQRLFFSCNSSPWVFACTPSRQKKIPPTCVSTIIHTSLQNTQILTSHKINRQLVNEEEEEKTKQMKYTHTDTHTELIKCQT